MIRCPLCLSVRLAVGRAVRRAAPCLLLVALALAPAGCGKRGAPVPPDDASPPLARPLPGKVSE